MSDKDQNQQPTKTPNKPSQPKKPTQPDRDGSAPDVDLVFNSDASKKERDLNIIIQKREK